jgi:transcriptional regulator with XRE-family HTH domain
MQNQPPAEFYVALGQRIRKYREARQMTQEALAHRVGLGRTSVTNIEKGMQQILAHQAVLFAEALGIEIDQLIETGPIPPSRHEFNLVPAGATEQEKAWVLNVMTRKS